MNPYMLAFLVMGIIYATIGVWALVAHLTGSLVLSAFGLMVCGAGCKISDLYLQ